MDTEGVLVPLYAVYVIGTVILVLIIIIIIQSIMIYKQRKVTYNLPSEYEESPIETERKFINRQVSAERSVPNSPSDDTEIRVFNNSFINAPREIDDIVIYDDLYAPKHIDGTATLNLSSKPRFTATSNIIQREQMRQICKDVLMKKQNGLSSSTKHLNDLLKGLNNSEDVNSENPKLNRCSSTPQLLDLYESPKTIASIAREDTVDSTKDIGKRCDTSDPGGFYLEPFYTNAKELL